MVLNKCPLMFWTQHHWGAVRGKRSELFWTLCRNWLRHQAALRSRCDLLNQFRIAPWAFTSVTDQLDYCWDSSIP